MVVCDVIRLRYIRSNIGSALVVGVRILEASGVSLWVYMFRYVVLYAGRANRDNSPFVLIRELCWYRLLPHLGRAGAILGYIMLL